MNQVLDLTKNHKTPWAPSTFIHFIKPQKTSFSGGFATHLPRTVLTSLFRFKPTKIRSFTIKTRVKQVLGTFTIPSSNLHPHSLFPSASRLLLRPPHSAAASAAAPARPRVWGRCSQGPGVSVTQKPPS